jgi:poly(hydroxyalkanoate) depolymerase family esterase
MNQKIDDGMAEATRLTRSGNLLEATALIQRLLKGAKPPVTHAAGPIIEGTYHVVDDAKPAQDAVRQPEPSQGLNQRSAAAPETARRTDEPISHRQEAAPAQEPKWSDRLRALFRAPGSAKRPPNRSETHPSREVSPGGRFIESAYTNAAGSRGYKLYIPTGYHGQALPLVVMLHGCTQSPDDAAAGTRLNELAETELFLVAYPAQSHSANHNKCWNWFIPKDQQRDSGEPSIIAGITRAIVCEYKLDSRRVYVAGMSAGGAMAAIMGAAYPDLYAAVGVHSGLAHGAARDLPSAFAAMQNGGARAMHSAHGSSSSKIVPTIVFHGDQDKTVHPRNGALVLEQCLRKGEGAKPRVTARRGQALNGHSYTASVYHDADGEVMLEHWLIHGAGHAWSGGSNKGSYTDPLGPDATREMVRFFFAHSI